ncbi:23S rRNA (adenine(2030)-N(6))-methyltransferase RlmJ [Campylobacter sp. MIT 19-121]|uniref:RsmD family RNA methyltransferase n=1 Tax=Campylobacter sp. MIT 19-121 TaxID=2703906 RepID=UPI0013895672|nr:RsmD family RNA methyltransferase [Campylobacter sp. MIT 19-121]NDJ27344.1 23S rRNA (adenine(2030)-N(6))-methyltransferase RlmJ [Campylobacter sp. MIT 19-121]
MNKNASNKKLFTLIQSGKFKGKKLILPSLKTTRSTKSIVKDCVFNVLQNQLNNRIFIEAFGGSAVMAASALSHYALKAYAIEKDSKAYEIALLNAKSIDENTLFVHKADSFVFLPHLLETLQDEVIIYLDPPFDIRAGFEDIYEKIINLILNLHSKNIVYIIIEHHCKILFDKNLGEFKQIKHKKFGNTSLSFYAHKSLASL